MSRTPTAALVCCAAGSGGCFGVVATERTSASSINLRTDCFAAVQRWRQCRRRSDQHCCTTAATWFCNEPPDSVESVNSSCFAKSERSNFREESPLHTHMQKRSVRRKMCLVTCEARIQVCGWPTTSSPPEVSSIPSAFPRCQNVAGQVCCVCLLPLLSFGCCQCQPPNQCGAADSTNTFQGPGRGPRASVVHSGAQQMVGRRVKGQVPTQMHFCLVYIPRALCATTFPSNNVFVVCEDC